MATDEEKQQRGQKEKEEYTSQLEKVLFQITPEGEQEFCQEYAWLKESNCLEQLHQEKKFKPYKEVGAIDQDVLTKYGNLVKQFKHPGYKLRKKGWLTKRLDERNIARTTVLTTTCGFALAGSIIGATFFTAPYFISIMGISGAFTGFIAGVEGSIRMEKRREKMKRYVFKKQTVEDAVQTVYRLHYVAQQMQEEVRDVNSQEQANKLFRKYFHSKDYTELWDIVKTAQGEVQKVVDYTGRLLDKAGVERPILMVNPQQTIYLRRL